MASTLAAATISAVPATRAWRQYGRRYPDNRSSPPKRLIRALRVG